METTKKYLKNKNKGIFLVEKNQKPSGKNEKPDEKKEGIYLIGRILNERGLSGTRPLFFTDNGEYKTQKGR